MGVPKRVGYIAPGTTYVDAGDDVTITPRHEGLMVLTVAASAAVKVYKKIDSVEIFLNSNQALVADSEFTFEFAVTPDVSFDLGFSGACTVREFVLLEFKDR